MVMNDEVLCNAFPLLLLLQASEGLLSELGRLDDAMANHNIEPTLRVLRWTLRALSNPNDIASISPTECMRRAKDAWLAAKRRYQDNEDAPELGAMLPYIYESYCSLITNQPAVAPAQLMIELLEAYNEYKALDAEVWDAHVNKLISQACRAGMVSLAAYCVCVFRSYNHLLLVRYLCVVAFAPAMYAVRHVRPAAVRI